MKTTLTYALNFFRIASFSLTLFMATGLCAQTSKSRVTVPSNKVLNVAERDGRFFVDLKANPITVEDQVQQMNTSFGLSDQYSFSLIQKSDDPWGFSHMAYQQYFKGVFIEEGLVLLHARNGLMNTYNGRVSKLPDGFSVKAQISENDAIALAKDALGFDEVHKQPEVTLVISRNGANPAYVLAYKVKLEGRTALEGYSLMQVFVDATTGTIVNKISLMAHAAVPGLVHTLYSGMQEVTMDSYEGGYRLRDELRGITTLNFETATITSRGAVQNVEDYTSSSTTWDQVPTLDSISLLAIGDPNLIRSNRSWTPAASILGDDPAKFRFQGPVKDYSKPAAAPYVFSNIGFSLLVPPYNIVMATLNNADQKSSGYAHFAIDSAAIKEGVHPWRDTLGNSGLYTIRKKGNPALDVHWGMSRTYDYFKETFGRYSYDGRKGPITSLVNGASYFLGSQANAAAINDGMMVFGLGDRYAMDAVVCLDVLGHEFAHMVVVNNGHGGLVYQGESGALNESFGDIFGTCIEFYTKKSDANWTIGEEVSLRAPGMFRSLASPKLTACPDTYQGTYWMDPKQLANDYGGVHYNSGVQNKWFYLLCEGGSGTNDKSDQYDVKEIGMEKAQQIVYRNLMNYLTPYSSYIDAYQGSIQATEDLYGAAGPEMESVKAAWFAVGLDASTTGMSEVKATADLLRVYPNPASDRINITVKVVKREKVALSLKDIMGKTVLQQNVDLPAPGEHYLQMDTRSLADGIYFMEMGNRPHRVQQKITIQR